MPDRIPEPNMGNVLTQPHLSLRTWRHALQVGCTLVALLCITPAKAELPPSPSLPIPHTSIAPDPVSDSSKEMLSENARAHQPLTEGPTPQNPEAGDVVIFTPRYLPSSDGYSPPLGTYTYVVDWEGIPAAKVAVSIEREGEHFRAKVQARTNSFIDIFYKLRYQVEGLLGAKTYTPETFLTIHKENSKTRNLNIQFHSDPFSGTSDIEATRTTGSGEVKHMRFLTHNLTLDPITAVFLARSLPWQVGDVRQFDTFNGKSRYLVTLKAVKLERLRVNGTHYDTIVIEPTVVNLVNQEQTKKLRKAYIYVSNDGRRDVVKVKSNVFIGSVNTSLESFVPPTFAGAPTKTQARVEQEQVEGSPS